MGRVIEKLIITSLSTHSPRHAYEQHAVTVLFPKLLVVEFNTASLSFSFSLSLSPSLFLSLSLFLPLSLSLSFSPSLSFSLSLSLSSLSLCVCVCVCVCSLIIAHFLDWNENYPQTLIQTEVGLVSIFT